MKITLLSDQMIHFQNTDDEELHTEEHHDAGVSILLQDYENDKKNKFKM